MIRNSHLSSFLFEKLKEMELGKNETAFCDQLIRIFSGSQRNMNEIKMPYIIVLSKGVGELGIWIFAEIWRPCRPCGQFFGKLSS